jgi:RNA polymerase-binding transcription factor DksA
MATQKPAMNVVPAKKAVEPSVKPAKKVVLTKKVEKPVVKSVAKSAKKTVPAKKTTKTAVIPVGKSVVKPTGKAVKSVQKPVVKPAEKLVVPIKKVVTNIVTKPVVKLTPIKSMSKPKTETKHKEEINSKSLPKPVKKTPEPIKDVKVPKTNVKTSVAYRPQYTPLEKRVDIHKSSASIIRYSDTDLTEFRDIINKKLETAKKELAYLQGLITRKDEMGGDESESRYVTMEDGGMSMEREQLSQMASRQIQYIDHLEKAIMRIENKTYGICRVTGKLIDKARLRAVPHATLSLEAKLGLVKPAGEPGNQ